MEREKYKIVRKKVKSYLKSSGVTFDNKVNNFVQSCIDDYSLALEKGKTSNEAMHQVLKSIDKFIGMNDAKNNKKIPYLYSIILSGFILLESFIIAILGIFITNVLNVFSVLYPLLFSTSLAFLILTIITFRKRNKLDFILSIVLFISTLVIFVQCVMYFYRVRTGNFYYSLFYIFPGILKFNRNELVSLEPLKYELTRTIVLFDPSFVISVMSFITSIIFKLIARRKKYVININC